ncbi:MAG: transketolase [Prolixibacteraceae bacterium]|nr:transketolase [Prolixibacteraceae bacterium]
MNKSYETKNLAKEIRKWSLQMVYNAKASHIGGALSMVDILAVLYNDILNIDPSNSKNPQRDRFLLSKGHACTGLYATLALKGFFPIENLTTYAQDGSIFLSHTNHHIPGIEISAGSLGHALPVSCGLALAAKRKKADWKTYCLVSDGELDEGSNWEAILFAPQHKLDNLILIVDYNKIQSLGTVKEVIDLHPLKEKLEAFRWEVYEVNGHDHQVLKSTFEKARDLNGKPKVIIANTIKGKGISFMEDKLLWHYKSPSEAQYNEAINELNIQ